MTKQQNQKVTTYKSSFKSKKFTTYYQLYRPKKSERLVIFLHSLGEHQGIYTSFLTHLASHGVDVIGVDLPGHGLSSGERFYIDSFDDYYSWYLEFINEHNKDYQEINIIGVGLGGLIALGAISHQQLSCIRSMIFMNPFIKFELPRNFLSDMTHNFFENSLFRRKVMAKTPSYFDFMCSHEITDHLIRQITIESKNVLLLPYLIHCPVLILIGEECGPIFSEKIELFVSTVDKDLVKLINYTETTGNLIFSDYYEILIGDLKRWLSLKR